MKTRVLAVVTALAFTAPAFAEDANKIDPAKSGPTESITEKVPDMKAPAGDAKDAQQPPTKDVGNSVPPMKPDDKADASKDSTTTSKE